ncbi:hypothetical protein [Microbacterium sp.]|uniref:hypothetical protein n=1 Tax=Microbacterium sp. TaxID=51671 RepID=UPI003F6E9B6C
MTMTDPGLTNVGTTTWREATYPDGWNEFAAIENAATWATVIDESTPQVSKAALLAYATTRLKRLLNAKAASTRSAVTAQRALAVLLVESSATPQTSATDDGGVLIEWLVNRASLHMRIDPDGDSIEIWGMSAEGVVVLDDVVPSRQFSTSPSRLSARVVLRELSSGVENRVAVDG